MRAAAMCDVCLQFFLRTRTVVFPAHHVFSVGLFVCVCVCVCVNYFVLCTSTVHRCMYKNAVAAAQQNPGIPVGRG